VKDYVNYGRDGSTLELLMIFFTSSTAINLVVLLPLLYGVASSSTTQSGSTKLVVDESFSALIVKSTVQYW